MPQVTPRLPNSSGGGSLPQFVIDEKLWNRIKAIAKGKRPAKFRSGIVRVTSRYLWLVEAALSAKRLNRRKDRFSRLRRNLGNARHDLEALQNGDEGDFEKALIERSLSHPLLDHDPVGKLDKFGCMVRDFESVARAVETACDDGRKKALASAQAGLQPSKMWDVWVRDMAGLCERQGLSTTVRKDELAVSAFPVLIGIVQSALDRPYRQHTRKNALSPAVWRALGQRPKRRPNSPQGTKGSGRKKAGV